MTPNSASPSQVSDRARMIENLFEELSSIKATLSDMRQALDDLKEVQEETNEKLANLNLAGDDLSITYHP